MQAKVRNYVAKINFAFNKRQQPTDIPGFSQVNFHNRGKKITYCGNNTTGRLPSQKQQYRIVILVEGKG